MARNLRLSSAASLNLLLAEFPKLQLRPRLAVYQRRLDVHTATRGFLQRQLLGSSRTRPEQRGMAMVENMVEFRQHRDWTPRCLR